MKVFAYQVHRRSIRTLESLLENLASRPLEDRYVDGGGGMRLETVDKRNNYICLDFSRGRGGHGPGRRTRQTAVRPIGLGEGEELAEDTAMVFDPVSQYAVIQYNHYGPRATSIEKYLFAADLDIGDHPPLRPGQRRDEVIGFDLAVCLRRDAETRLNRLNLVRELQFAVSVQGAREADLDRGRSLFRILDTPMPGGIDVLEVRMRSKGQSQSTMDRSEILELIEDIRRLGDDAAKAKIRGKESEQHSIEPIDLLKDRLEEEIFIELDDSGRYPRDERWRLLSTQLRHWLSIGQLPVA